MARRKIELRSDKRQTGRKAKPRQPRRMPRLLSWTLVLGIWTSVALGAVVAWYAYDLPDLGRIAEMTRRPSVTLLDAQGQRIAAVGDVYGESIRVEDLPPHVPAAVMAVEDRRFYGHFGVDPIGLARAMWTNLRAGAVVQGGSSITQQLAKVLFLSPERTIERKVQELLLALWLEHKFSKDQILTLYLNRVYFGAGTFGIDAAAQRYFGKPAARINLYEAAMLAGLIKAPSRYNPARDAGLADQRAALALTAMVEAEYVSLAEAQEAFAAKSQSQAVGRAEARYFTDWVLNQIPGFIGQIDRDLVVVTTLDRSLQRIAEEEAAALIYDEGRAVGASQVAFAALTPGGAVRAMVGGRDYLDSQFNRAAQALRQPGSAFKLFVYLTAIEQGWTPDHRITDGPITIEDWTPRNYGDRYFGEVTLREAFARSLNSVAVQLVQQLGPERVAQTARRLGITSALAAHPSIALGTSEVTLLELTSAYAAFANRGMGVWPYGIEEIRDSAGQILYRRAGDGPGRVLGPDAIAFVNDLMTAGITWGTGKAANPDRPAAGKTGTSQDFRDAWFVGFTADLVAGVWLGNDDGKAMQGVTGGSLPARLWGRVVTRGLEGVPSRPIPGPTLTLVDGAWQPDGFKPEVPQTAAYAPTSGDEGFIGRILSSLSSVFEDEEDPAQGGRPAFDSGPQR